MEAVAFFESRGAGRVTAIIGAMPLAISQGQLGAPPTILRRRPWTRKDYEVLESTGAFEGQRYELVEGELIDKMSVNPPHAAWLSAISAWLNRVFAPSTIRSHGPIDVRPEDNPTSQPQPDACVTLHPFHHYVERHPMPSEILLLIEVSDSTLDYDTTTKAGLYARAGIADYWVFDVAKRRIIVHRSPVDGAYQSLTVYEEHEAATPIAAPDVALRCSDLFA